MSYTFLAERINDVTATPSNLLRGHRPKPRNKGSAQLGPVA